MLTICLDLALLIVFYFIRFIWIIILHFLDILTSLSKVNKDINSSNLAWATVRLLTRQRKQNTKLN
jgi:hypothetical protein